MTSDITTIGAVYEATTNLWYIDHDGYTYDLETETVVIVIGRNESHTKFYVLFASDCNVHRVTAYNFETQSRSRRIA